MKLISFSYLILTRATESPSCAAELLLCKLILIIKRRKEEGRDEGRSKFRKVSKKVERERERELKASGTSV